jgi:hypothetical protein
MLGIVVMGRMMCTLIQGYAPQILMNGAVALGATTMLEANGDLLFR